MTMIKIMIMIVIIVLQGDANRETLDFAACYAASQNEWDILGLLNDKRLQ